MTDGIIKGTGNSRYLKSVANAMTLYPTHEALMEALAAGTFPVDLNGINSAGWNTMGTALNKANLLTDTVASLYGLNSAATPNDIFGQGLCRISIGEYSGTLEGDVPPAPYNYKLSLYCSFAPKVIMLASGYYSKHIERVSYNNYIVNRYFILWKPSSVFMHEANSGNSYQCDISWLDNGIEFPGTVGALLNKINYKYMYVFLG